MDHGTMISISKSVVAVFIFFLFILAVSCNPTEKVTRPNILLIMTDQQPVSCVGAYGNAKIKTPNLDQLAGEGLLLQNFYIAAFPCSPSRASILSGRYLHHHNVSTNNVKMDSTIPVLGSILSDAGYRSAYFGKAHLSGSMYVGRSDGDGIDYLHSPQDAFDPVGNDIKDYWYYDRIDTDSGWNLQKQFGGLGEDQPQLGFEVWQGGWRNYKDWLIEQGEHDLARLAGNHDDLQSAPEGEHMYSKLGEDYHMAKFFTDETEAFIQQNDREPWVAVLSYFGPHLPVAPPRPWDTLYSINSIDLPPNFHDDLKGKPEKQDIISTGYFRKPWTRNQYKDYIRRYWGYCGYIDAQIGRVFDLLKNTGHWDNTLILFTSDHGDMLAGHGMIFKLGMNGYDELFKVPAIIKLPFASGRGTISGALTSSIDLLPTILSVAGIRIPKGVDGKSLLPIFEQPSEPFREYIFAEIHGANNDGKTIMCRNQRYKLVYHWLSKEIDELYDLHNDPGELTNLVHDPNHDQIRSSMYQAIFQWAEKTDHQYVHLIRMKATKASLSSDEKSSGRDI